MSLPTPATISCPQCGNSCRVMIWNTVNATVDPALRQRVLDYTINRITCAHCKQKISVNTDLLYHDMDRKFLVWLVQPERPVPFSLPESYVESTKGWHSHRLRFVTSHSQLVEKITIFEAGLSDFLIETLKLFVWIQKFPQKGITDDSMYFCPVHNESSPDAATLTFELHQQGKFLGRIDAPFQMYTAGMANPIGSPTYRLGEWIIVNQSNIGSF